MIGLCFEAETTCGTCGNPLPINALTGTIVCSHCLKETIFTVKEWKKLTGSLFKEGPTYQENEGTPSTMIGARTYKILYGRQNPKFLDTKKYMDMDAAIKSAGSGMIINPETNVAYSIRPVPEEFKELCPNVKFLLCEDFTQLPNYSGPSEVLNQSAKGGLIPFICPSCGGTMQINGKERTFKCQFCSTESYIPDDVWQKMHPVKTKQRFYFWFDENSMIFDWDADVYDIAADAEGHLFMSIKPIFGSDDDFWVVALNPDLTIKWKRNDLKFKTDKSGGEPKLGLTIDNELIVWSEDRHTMLILATADGSEIKRIGKKAKEGDKTPASILDFTQCRYIAADIDGNYFALVARDEGKSSIDSTASWRNPSHQDNYCEFMVVDQEASLHKPWGMEEAESKGFGGTLKKIFSNMGEDPYFDSIKDKVYRCRDFDVKISVGADGSYYLLCYHNLAKYDRGGKQIYLTKIDNGYIPHKIVGDKQGNAYYILDAEKPDSSILMKISPDGSSTTPLVKSILEGGFIFGEKLLALSSKSVFYALGNNGRIRTFDMDGKLLYASPKSMEEAEKERKK
jgi:hypothetical protein